MAVSDFRKAVNELRNALANARGNQVSIFAVQKDSGAGIRDYKERKNEHLRNAVLAAVSFVEKKSRFLNEAVAYDSGNERVVAQILLLVNKIRACRNEGVLEKLVDELVELCAELVLPKECFVGLGRNLRLPAEIRGDVLADIAELDKCFRAGCYRSAVVLCGRILETALHRKYFEATGNDLLEKSPGIGLGNLIARMQEHGIKLDPALANQIHMINQVRVHSVHKKQEAFSPSMRQAEAMILYTIDVLEKLF